MKNILLNTEIPGPKSKALMAERMKHVAKSPFHVTPVFAASTHGATVEDVDGNRLVDFAAGIGVLNVGHTQEDVVSAVQSQAAKMLHASFNVTPYESYIRLCEKLNQTMPGDFAKKTFLANSGAEAVENAIKIARAYTGKQGVICFDHAFHGRTYMAMTLTSKAKPYRFGFGPYNPEVYRAPFPYAYRWPTGSDPAQVSEECFKQFEELVNSRIAATQVAAVIIEPVQGEGGFLPAPREFMEKLRAFCTANQIVLIADEIQSGFGRTGTLFACEQLGVAPDLMTTAKGMGGGMPISAVTGRAEIMDSPVEGSIGGTFGGNPLSCEAALQVFRLFEDGTLLKKSRALGARLREKLIQWEKTSPFVGDVRGMGPMLAVEFVKNKTTKEPFPEAAKNLVRYAYENGVITMSAGSYGNAIRFLMPLTLTEEQFSEGFDVLDAGLKAIHL